MCSCGTADGKQCIDAFAGLLNVNVGHGRAELADAAAAQIREVEFVPTFLAWLRRCPLSSQPGWPVSFLIPSITSSSPLALPTERDRAQDGPLLLVAQGLTGEDQDLFPQDGLSRDRHGARSPRRASPHTTRVPPAGAGSFCPPLRLRSLPHRNAEGTTEDEFIAALLKGSSKRRSSARARRPRSLQ